MKKNIIALIAGALLTLSTSSAFAYFQDGDLFVAAYNSSTATQLVLDLGTLSLDTTGTYYVLTPNASNTFNLSTLGASTTAGIQVAFFGLDSGVTSFASSATTSQPYSAFGKQSGFQSAEQAINATAGATNQLWSGSTAAGTNGYTQKMNASAVGSFAQLNNGQTGSTGSNFVNPEISLASLTAGATQGIWGFAYQSARTAGTLDFTATITDAGGIETVTINNPNAVASTPIPAAAYLLGSGLLGLFGLRRKQNA